tara:strand:+ start:2808 stop:2963 length:156 start_codon:yes stop_codon:yes gene_type:complete
MKDRLIAVLVILGLAAGIFIGSLTDIPYTGLTPEATASDYWYEPYGDDDDD